MRSCHSNINNKGFTLIEVLLVIVVVGIMVAAIQVNFSSNKPEALLEQESARFASVFNLAGEYGLLNNIELGLYIQQNSYQFVGFDGVRWSPLPDNDMLAVYQLPEAVVMSLVFDDLPLEQPSLVNAELFTPDDELLEEMRQDLSDDEKPILPHVFLLSGGDITPFRVIFSLQETTAVIPDISFHVTGLYSTPVSLTGPFINGERRD